MNKVAAQAAPDWTLMVSETSLTGADSLHDEYRTADGAHGSRAAAWRQPTNVEDDVQQARYSIVETLNCLGKGALLVDRDARITRRNELADAVLSQQDGVREKDGKFYPTKPHIRQQFAALLQAGLSRAMPAHDTPAMLIPRPSGRAGYVLSVLPGDNGGEAPRLVILQDPTCAHQSMKTRLQCLFEFTGAEADVAVQLLAGASVGRIALNSGRATATVRVHVRNLLSKSRVHRQSELIIHLMRCLH